MQTTFFSILMTVLWSSILILIFYILRTRLILVDLCSISGVIILYLFCMIRMVVPVEFPWTKVVSGGILYNRVKDIFYFQLEIGIDIPVYLVLLTIWFLGSALILLRYSIQYLRVVCYFEGMPIQRSSRTTEVMDKIWDDKVKKPDIIQTAVVDSPCCVGILRKRIIIPDKQYSEDELYYILLHEYLHMKSKDTLTINIINVLCALYWWNPCVYLLKKDLNQSMEIRCDTMVAKELDKELKSDYLTLVLEEFKCSQKNGKYSGHNRLMMQLLSNNSELLFERFKLVAAERGGFSGKKNILAWIIASFLLVISYSFIVQTSYEAPKTDILTVPSAYEVDSGNSYLIKTGDGNYIFHSQEDDIPINEEVAQMMMKDGFNVIDDRR